MSSEIILSGDSLMELKGEDAQELVMLPGKLNTTLDKSAVDSGALTELVNCDADEGVFKRDQRRRKFQNPFTVGDAQGIGYAEYGGCEELFAVHAQGIGQIDASESANADGNTDTAWENLTSPASIGADEDFVIWQYRRWFFGASRSRFFQKEICTSLVRNVGETSANPGSATWNFNPPGYTNQWFEAADTITVTSDAGAADTIGTPAVDGAGQIVVPYTWHNSAGNPQVRLKIVVDFSTAKVWTSRGYIGFRILVGSPHRIGGVGGVTVLHTYLYQTGAVAAGDEKMPRTKTFVSGPTGGVLDIWCDCNKIASALMAAVERFEIEFYLRPKKGFNNIYVVPIILGGSYLNQLGIDEVIDGDVIVPAPKMGPHVEDLKYSFRYKHDATAFSDLYSFTVPGRDALGSPQWPQMGLSQVYLGTWVDIKIPQNLTGGFVAADTIELYREIEGEKYLLSSGANGATGLSYTDKLTGYYIRNNITPTPGMNLGGIDAANLTGITFGCEWKGSNVLFRTDGLAYFSRVNTATDWLWEGPLVIGTVTGRIDDPVTLYISGNQGLPIISAVSLGPLYMWSRKKGYVLFGDLPSTASFPVLTSSLRGVLGSRASTPHYNGSIFGSDDGLWYVQADESLIGDRREPEMLELTADVRRSWQWLIGSLEAQRAKVVVRARGGEIWCFCEERILHRTRNKTWIPGSWADNAEVHDAVFDPFRGLICQMEDGSLCHIGNYSTDGGTNAAGSNGTAVRCSVAGPQFLVTARALAARGVYEWPDEDTTPDFTVTVVSELVPDGASVALARARGSDSRPFKSLEKVGSEYKPLAGRHFQVRIEFGGIGTLKKLWLKLGAFPQGSGDAR